MHDIYIYSDYNAHLCYYRLNDQTNIIQLIIVL
jgi:hypothetical protein